MHIFDNFTYLIVPTRRVCNVVKVEDVMEGFRIPDQAAIDILSAGPYWSQEEESDAMEKSEGNQGREQEPSAAAADFPRFSMAAGDFVDLYGRGENAEYHANSWDAVITCFFVDTAPVVLE